jgi:hypothetical protein
MVVWFMYFYLCLLGFSIFYAVCSFVSLWWVCLICIICMALHVVARDQLWRLIKWGYAMRRLYDIVSRLLTVTWWKRRCWSPALITLTMLDLCNNLKYYLYDYCQLIIFCIRIKIWSYCEQTILYILICLLFSQLVENRNNSNSDDVKRENLNCLSIQCLYNLPIV